MKTELHYSSVYFLSDVHLGISKSSKEKKKEQLLLSFLEHIKDNSDLLIILGDLFEFWFEYRTAIPKEYIWVVSKLKELLPNTRLIYLAGNHDYWLGDFFAKELCAEFHSDSLELTIQGKRLFLAHGDALIRGDFGYKLMKSIFRNSLCIFLFRLIHPDIGIPFAKYLAYLSRQKEEVPDTPYIEYAKKKLNEGFDAVVFGHTHNPCLLEESGKTYLNTGDWVKHRTYAKLFEGKFSLLTWHE